MDKANSKKIILGELDIGEQQVVWFNYSPFTWYVDFDAEYDRIGSEFLSGVSAQDIVSVGSVACDAAPLREAASVAAVEAEENTFFWDATTRRCYIHLVDGDRPSLHRMVIGIVYGVANHGVVLEGTSTIYWPRLKGAPRISKSRDPLFYGRLEYGGGTLSLDNSDGVYNLLAEDEDVFGNSLRLFLGFDNEPRASFRQLYSGTVGKIKVGQTLLDIDVADNRKYLIAEIPDKVFTLDDYPDLKPGNNGKHIPVGYGVLRNVPVVCTNEDESPAPATYIFKVLDVSRHPHGMHAISAVRVDGVAKTPASTDPTNGTFTLAAADYDPGQKVTADIEGYEDDSGALIFNPLDIITDIIERWLGIPYSATAYDQALWAAMRLQVPDVAYFANKPTKVNEIIEEICVSIRGLFLSDRFGRWSFRIVNHAAYPVRTLEGYRLLEAPVIEYDPEQTIGVALIGYDRNWSEDEFKYLRDDSRRAEVLARYKLAPEQTFDTLLTNSADAQAFATAALAEGAFIQRPFSVRGPMSDVLSEIGDIVHTELICPDGQPFIGTVRAEVIGVDYDLLIAQEVLHCLIIEVERPSTYIEGDFYNDLFYGDGYWAQTRKVAA